MSARELSVEEELRQCTRCGISKAPAGFYQHSSGRLMGYCRDCHNKKLLAKRAEDPEKERRRKRKQQLGELEKRREKKRAYRKAHPEKHTHSQPAYKRAAQKAVQRAVARGELVRPGRCEGCDAAVSLHAHHADYSKPLEVEWLCPSCHGLVHAHGSLAAARAWVGSR